MYSRCTVQFSDVLLVHKLRGCKFLIFIIETDCYIYIVIFIRNCENREVIDRKLRK